ncbi:GNAT family N-acetyltransferase [Thermoactinomyces mirandus]|uniref:GNAT family N-acetyltransferase n=1 Tax=Thermoactinomyces mirandus TaxID=2756294 RepID=UPI001C68933B|nr:GNAT family N-acetyltransferase [Thermoactinomyces mirandus]
MTTIVKKAITDSDLNHVFSIRTKVFVEEQNVPKDLEIDEWEEKSTHFLAWENELPIGTCRLRFVDPFTAKAERVAVLKEKRKTGAGKLLMQTLENVARQKGARKILLYAQVRVIPFYKKLGYEPFGTPFDDAGIPHMKMEKSLR